LEEEEEEELYGSLVNSGGTAVIRHLDLLTL